MGYDLHVITEIKIGDKWNPLEMKLDLRMNGEIAYSPENRQVCVYRNTDLFHALTGLDGYGSKVPVISLPRGIPDDSSDYVKEYLKYCIAEYEDKTPNEEGYRYTIDVSYVNFVELRLYKIRSVVAQLIDVIEQLVSEYIGGVPDDMLRICFYYDH